MHRQEPDSALEALPNTVLRTRLARTGWEHDPEFVPDEQVFRLFRRAREAGNKDREIQFSELLSRRLLERSRRFALKSKIYPGLISDLKRASHEIASELWECLVTSQKDAAFAERAFGRLFECRAISFQRKLLAKKRKMQVNIEALESSDEGESPDAADRTLAELQDEITPEDTLARKQEFQQVDGRLQAILTQNEYSTYVMLYVEEMMVKDIAAAFGVTTKSINNYKNAALEKIQKEFKQ